MISAFVSHYESPALNKSYWVFGLKVNSSKSIIENLVPGAQYQVVMYLRKGPLVGPPSDPVTFAIGKLPASRITLSGYFLGGGGPMPRSKSLSSYMGDHTCSPNILHPEE